MLSQPGPLHSPCSGSLGPWRMWPRATSQQQGPLSLSAAGGVGSGPSGQGRGHDLSYSGEDLLRLQAQPGQRGVLQMALPRATQGPPGNSFGVRGSNSVPSNPPCYPQAPIKEFSTAALRRKEHVSADGGPVPSTRAPRLEH